MATWMAHLRIADDILDKMQGLEATEFVIGNIAPDSGVPTPDVLSWLLRPLADRYFVGTGDCFFIKRKRRRGISKNPQETIWKWKGDWYDLDFLYLKRDYIWLTQERMNAFVTYAAEIVLEKNNMIK